MPYGWHVSVMTLVYVRGAVLHFDNQTAIWLATDAMFRACTMNILGRHMVGMSL